MNWTYFFIGLWLSVFVYDFFKSTDSTDKSMWSRSGMAVYTDNATGVQYVRAGWWGGALTPRIDITGKPLIEVQHD